MEANEKIIEIKRQMSLELEHIEQLQKENSVKKEQRYIYSKEIFELQQLLKQEVTKSIGQQLSIKELNLKLNSKDVEIASLKQFISELEKNMQPKFKIIFETQQGKQNNCNLYQDLVEMLKVQLKYSNDENMKAEQAQQDIIRQLVQQLQEQTLNQNDIILALQRKEKELNAELQRSLESDQLGHLIITQNSQIKQLTADSINSEKKLAEAEKLIKQQSKELQVVKDKNQQFKEQYCKIIKTTIVSMKNEQQKLCYFTSKQQKQYQHDQRRIISKVIQILKDIEISHEEDKTKQYCNFKARHEYILESAIELEKLHQQELEQSTRQQMAHHFQELNSQLTIQQKKLQLMEVDNQQLASENEALFEQTRQLDSELYYLESSYEHLKCTIQELLLESQTKFKKCIQPQATSKEFDYLYEHYNLLQTLMNGLECLIDQTNEQQQNNYSKQSNQQKNYQDCNLIHLLTIQESEIGGEDEEAQQQQFQYQQQIQQQELSSNSNNNESLYQKQNSISIQFEKQSSQIKKNKRKGQIKNQSCLEIAIQTQKESSESLYSQLQTQIYSFRNQTSSRISYYNQENTSQI